MRTILSELFTANSATNLFLYRYCWVLASAVLGLILIARNLKPSNIAGNACFGCHQRLGWLRRTFDPLPFCSKSCRSAYDATVRREGISRIWSDSRGSAVVEDVLFNAFLIVGAVALVIGWHRELEQFFRHVVDLIACSSGCHG